MNKAQLTFNPPRMVNEPMMPLPQTVCATLEHSGLPQSQLENITDIPPDLGWLSNIQLFKSSFKFSNADNPKDQIWSTFVHTHKDGDNLAGTGNFSAYDSIYWNYLPFMGSRYWNGIVSYKFIAIKPPKATGKLLIRYSFDPTYLWAEDTLRRSVAVEWDLGQSSEIILDFSGLNPLEARPTWLPIIDRETFEDKTIIWRKQVPPIPVWNYGKIMIECAQRYNPGSLFPDSTRILAFIVYKNASFYMPTDFRSSWNNTLLVGDITSDEV